MLYIYILFLDDGMTTAHVLTMAHHISFWKGFEATTSRGLCTPSGCLVPPPDGMGNIGEH